MNSAEKAAQAVIDLACGEEGYLEKASNHNLDSKTGNAGYQNYTKYARDIDTEFKGFYNGPKNGYAWCDCFADWPFLKLFGKETACKLLCAPMGSAGAGCCFSADYFRSAGRFHNSPKKGDQIFFGPSGRETHVGIVTGVDDRYVYTVEGNTDPTAGVVPNGGSVRQKKYALNYSRISGYGRPDYGIVAHMFGGNVEPDYGGTPIEAPARPIKPASKWTMPTYSYELPVFLLKKGMQHEQVYSAQLLLTGRSYDCGAPDSKFGNKTEDAVKEFQRDLGLLDDGEIGIDTWDALVNG